MEPGDSTPDPDSNRLPELPPPPPLPYRAILPEQSVGWISVASYAGAGQWHAANKLLARRGIIAQMKVADGPDGGFDLLVLQTEAEWARDLLSGGSTPKDPGDCPTYGFPISAFPKLNPEPSSAIKAVPVSDRGLTDHQKATYTIWIVILWIVLAAVVLIVILVTSLLPNF